MRKTEKQVDRVNVNQAHIVPRNPRLEILPESWGMTSEKWPDVILGTDGSFHSKFKV